MRILLVAPDGTPDANVWVLMSQMRNNGQVPVYPYRETLLAELATVGGYYLMPGWSASARCRAVDLLATEAGLRRYGRVTERTAP